MTDSAAGDVAGVDLAHRRRCAHDRHACPLFFTVEYVVEISRPHSTQKQAQLLSERTYWPIGTTFHAFVELCRRHGSCSRCREPVRATTVSMMGVAGGSRSDPCYD